MTPQQLIRTILDAVAEDDLRKAEDAIEKYSNGYLVWAVENHSVDYEGFSLSKFSNGTYKKWMKNKYGQSEEISLKKFYELFTQQK
jgi:hypothetical protein